MDPILISKSHAETAWNCRRAEYYSYVFGGTGLRGSGQSFHLDFGTIVHDALAHIARTVGQPDIIGPLATTVRERIYTVAQAAQMDVAISKQWASIGEGLIRAFYQRTWPTLMREYEVISVEQACVSQLTDDTWFIARPDLILKHRRTGGYWYWEYKTTGFTDGKWVNSWAKAVQVHSGIKAAQDTLKVEFEGCMVFGLSKGRRDHYNDIQTSPFAYGWVNHGVPGILDSQYLYTATRGKGWERFATHSLVEGLGPWIAAMPTELLDAQFVRTPPISLRTDLVEDFFEQLRHRALEISDAREQLAHVTTAAQARDTLNRYFPQSFKNCTPLFGAPCGYNDICFNQWVAKDPLASLMYQRRTVEHQDEFIKIIRRSDVAA
jgi:hypothetical protein